MGRTKVAMTTTTTKPKKKTGLTSMNTKVNTVQVQDETPELARFTTHNSISGYACRYCGTSRCVCRKGEDYSRINKVFYSARLQTKLGVSYPIPDIAMVARTVYGLNNMRYVINEHSGDKDVSEALSYIEDTKRTIANDLAMLITLACAGEVRYVAPKVIHELLHVNFGGKYTSAKMLKSMPFGAEIVEVLRIEKRMFNSRHKPMTRSAFSTQLLKAIMPTDEDDVLDLTEPAVQRYLGKLTRWCRTIFMLDARYHKNHFGSYAGYKWALCSDIAYKYYSGKLPVGVFLDVVFDLMHNGASIFNKTSLGSEWLSAMLDSKNDEDTENVTKKFIFALPFEFYSQVRNRLPSVVAVEIQNKYMRTDINLPHNLIRTFVHDFERMPALSRRSYQVKMRHPGGWLPPNKPKKLQHTDIYSMLGVDPYEDKSDLTKMRAQLDTISYTKCVICRVTGARPKPMYTVGYMRMKFINATSSHDKKKFYKGCACQICELVQMHMYEVRRNMFGDATLHKEECMYCQMVQEGAEKVYGWTVSPVY